MLYSGKVSNVFFVYFWFHSKLFSTYSDLTGSFGDSTSSQFFLLSVNIKLFCLTF